MSDPASERTAGSGGRAKRGTGVGEWTLAASLIAAHVALALHGASVHSAVFDEVVYAPAGYAYLTTGDYRLNAEHPPLLKLWTALPWIGTGLSTQGTPGWEASDQWRFGIAMLFESGHDPRALLARSRAMIVVLSAVAAVGVFLTARWTAALVDPRGSGSVAGMTALALYAFDPLVIGHAGLATTDVGGASLFFLASAATLRALRVGGRGVTVAAGVLTGAALASKFTAVLLLGLLPVAAWLAARPDAVSRPGHASRPWGTAGWIAVIAGAVLVATYGPAGPARYVEGLGMLLYHGEVGHPAYAFGHYGREGWWWYFPAAWAVKTPIPILAASLAGVAVLAAQWKRGAAAAVPLLLAPAAVAAIASGSSLNLGVRHLLPATPFLAVAAGVAAQRVWRFRAGRAAVVAVVAWLAIGTARVHPDEIAYANEVAGGPERLWTRLADSNVDWGQDLPALVREVSRAPLRMLYLAYLGTADPAAYGLPAYVWIPSFDMIPKRSARGPDPEGREWIAVSVTNLLGVYSASHDAYAWLRERRRAAFPGHSIALFDITGDAEAHRTIGAIALSYGEAAAAATALLRAVELRPDDGAAWEDLARANAELGRFPEARECCVEAARLMPDSVATRELCERIRAQTGSGDAN